MPANNDTDSILIRPSSSIPVVPEQRVTTIADVASRYWNALPKFSTGSKVTLAMIGLCAGSFYYETGLDCAKDENCGLWLSDLITEQGAHAVFTISGGLGFGVLNAYLAMSSLNDFIEYLDKQETYSDKLKVTILATVLTITQTMPLLFACIGTNAPLWAKTLTVGGGLPSALYGVIGFMENEYPRLLSTISWTARQYYLFLLIGLSKVSLHAPLTAEQSLELTIMAHYAEQYSLIVNQADANWKYIIRNVYNHDFDMPSLPFLLTKYNAIYIPPTTANQALNLTGRVTGGVLGLMFSYSFACNSYNVLQDYLGIEALSIGLTIFFNLAQVYGNLKLSVAGTNRILETSRDLLFCQTFESIPYQKRKELTISVTALLLTLATLSYASVNIVTTGNYNGPDMYRFRIGACTGINIYHYEGMMRQYELLLGEYTLDQNERILFNIRHELLELHKTPLTQLQYEAKHQTKRAEILDVIAHESETIEPIREIQDDDVIIEDGEITRVGPPFRNKQALITTDKITASSHHSSDDDSDNDEEDQPRRVSYCTSVCSSIYSLFSTKKHTPPTNDPTEVIIVTNKRTSLQPLRDSRSSVSKGMTRTSVS